MRGSLEVGRRFTVEEDGDEVFTRFEDVRCSVRIECGGAPLVKQRHDNPIRGWWWRCPKCGSYYGEAKHSSKEPSK